MHCWRIYSFMSLDIFLLGNYFIMYVSTKKKWFWEELSFSWELHHAQIQMPSKKYLPWLDVCLTLLTSKPIPGLQRTPLKSQQMSCSFLIHCCCMVPMHCEGSRMAFPPCLINSYSSLTSVTTSSVLALDIWHPPLHLDAFIPCTPSGYLQTTPSLISWP